MDAWVIAGIIVNILVSVFGVLKIVWKLGAMEQKVEIHDREIERLRDHCPLLTEVGFADPRLKR